MTSWSEGMLTIPAPRRGAVAIVQKQVRAEVLAAGPNGLLVKGHALEGRGIARVVSGFGEGEISRAVTVKSIEARQLEGDPVQKLVIVHDPALPLLMGMENESASGLADRVRHLTDTGALSFTPKRRRVIGTVRGFGGSILVAAAAVLFAGSAYGRYGVATMTGAIEATDVTLVRAESPGVFYPYSTGSHLLKNGELIGVIDGTSGRPVSVASNCECYLGDFPVGAGSTIHKGAVVARLVSPQSKAEVIAPLPSSENWQIAAGDPVEIDTGSGSVPGRIVAIESDRGAAVSDSVPDGLADARSVLRISLDQVINPALYGRIVEVRVLRAEAAIAKAAVYLGIDLNGVAANQTASASPASISVRE